MVTVQSLGIDRLSREDRIRLVQDIWDTIKDEPTTTTFTDEQRRELERRVAKHKANPDDVLPWEQILAETLAELKK
jgi:putative addiction module component (TIGR02574 family)